MPDVQSTLQSKVIDLASEALTGFCEDMSGMFGVEMSCEQVSINENASQEIKKHFKKLGAVYSVNVTGALNNDFRILVDKSGLFTVTGVVVMLPKSRILSSAKRGTLMDATEISDAVGEVGNLMVGSWDRIFREGFQDNTHFSHTGTFVGDPCAEDNDVIDLASDEEVTFVSYDMSVGDYPAFKCGVYLPSRLFDVSESKAEPDAQDAAVPEVKEDTPPEPEAPIEPVEAASPVAEVAPVPEPQETPAHADKAQVEAGPEEKTDQVAETTQTPESEEPPTPMDEAHVETAPTETAEPDASIAQATDSQETPVQTDEAPVEAKPAEGADPVLLEAYSVSDTPAATLLARHLMQTQVHWVSVDDTVNQAQTKMQETGSSYLLVGDGAKLEGIVTRSDLDSAASIYLRPIFSKWRRPEDDATLQIRLKWIMSKQVYSVKPETPLCNIVHLKCKYDVSCLPVVDAEGQTLGVVTTKDLLKGVVNKDLEGMGVAVA
jgi:CBS domain-containing protein